MEACPPWDERYPYDGCGSFAHSPFTHILPLCCFFFLLAKHLWIWHLPPFLDTHPCRNRRPWSIKALKIICRVVSGSKSPWTCAMCYWNRGNSAHAAVFCQISTRALWTKLHQFLYQSLLTFFYWREPCQWSQNTLHLSSLPNNCMLPKTSKHFTYCSFFSSSLLSWAMPAVDFYC